jgi:DNA invertase Pin-like site-specific DNA recombinase
MHPAPTRLAVAYIRVSTVNQAQEGVSLEAQEARIRAWAAGGGWELLAVHQDAGLSGSSADHRPGVQAAVEEACRRKAALVVYSLSRLARSTRDAIDISQRLDHAGADLVSLSEAIDTTSATGRLMFRLMSVLAEFEREQLVERTTMAMAHMRHEHRQISYHPPYGWDHSEKGRMVRNDREQAVLDEMIAMHTAGTSWSEIAQRLTEMGITTKRNGTWRGDAVKAIVKREMSVRAHS